MDTEMSWDDFLTEQDKAHLDATWSKTEPFGFGTRPAVLVIDDYYSVLGLTREPILESVKTWPMSTGLEGWEAIDRTVGAAGLRARRRTCRSSTSRAWTAGSPRRGARRQRSERLGRVPEEFRSKANEIVEEIAPQPGDLVIQKAAPSAFWGTPLTFYLQLRRHRHPHLLRGDDVGAACAPRWWTAPPSGSAWAWWRSAASTAPRPRTT